MANPKLANTIGIAALFLIALGICWVMALLLNLSYDRALLVEILWLTAMNLWHQPEKRP